MEHQRLQLDAVFLRQRHCTLQHCIFHDAQNFGVVDGLIDILPANVAAKIRAGRVAHIVDEQLAFDVEVERLKRNQILNLRNLALERRQIDRQEAVALDADAHRVAVLHFFRLHRHHASDGCFDQTDAHIKQCLFFLGELLLEHPFEDFICVVQILADDDVERCVRPRPALAQARDNVRNDEFEDSRAHSRRHDVAIGNGLGGRFLIVAVDRCDVLDHNVLVSFARHIADRVLMLFLQSLHDRLRHVDERHLVARLAECRTDKAAANVAAAVHNCFFHSISLHNNFYVPKSPSALAKYDLLVR